MNSISNSMTLNRMTSESQIGTTLDLRSSRLLHDIIVDCYII